MTEVNGEAPPLGLDDTSSKLEPAERGRYAIFDQPDGGLLIARAVNLCDRCLDCGCGDQAEPVGPIPGSLVTMAKAAAAGKVKIPQAIRQAMRRG